MVKKKTQVKYETEEQKEIKKFFIVLIGLIVIILAIYLLTRIFVTKDLFESSSSSDVEYTAGEINYDMAIVGTMLNRPYDEYYVIAFDSEGTKANYYNVISSNYLNSDSALKLYYIDLANELNKQYVATGEDEITTSFTSIDNLKLGDVTLFKVKNGKVKKIITDIDSISKELAA
jgi:hypothetical protein